MQRVLITILLKSHYDTVTDSMLVRVHVHTWKDPPVTLGVLEAAIITRRAQYSYIILHLISYLDFVDSSVTFIIAHLIQNKSKIYVCCIYGRKRV